MNHRQPRCQPRLADGTREASYRACRADLPARAGRACSQKAWPGRSGARHRRGADAAGPAIPPRLYQRRAAARPVEGHDAGGQRRASGEYTPEDVRVIARTAPPTLVGGLDGLRDSRQHETVVVKPLRNGSGKAIFRIDENIFRRRSRRSSTRPGRARLVNLSFRSRQGDERIVLVDWRIRGRNQSVPGRCNSVQISRRAVVPKRPPAELEEICAAGMGPKLNVAALCFVGIDVIGGKWLTEINVTSPTGIVAIDKFNGSDTAGLIWDAIERRHGNMGPGPVWFLARAADHATDPPHHRAGRPAGHLRAHGIGEYLT